MRTRARVGPVLVAALLAAGCGGGDGDDEQAAEAGPALGAGPVIDVDPCDLLDADVAASLAGADVALADDPPGTALAASIGCSYRLADDDAGGAIAASLVLGSSDDDPEAAKEARVAELVDQADDAEVREIELGDATVAAVVTTETVVQVVYVVETVVVSVEVVPVEGVDEAATDAAVDFAETTVEPVREGFEAKQREAEPGGPAGDGDDDEFVQQGEIEGLWTGDWGTMAIEVDGDEVRAAYTHDDGRITGTFEDGVFRGRWTEIPSREGPNDAGDVEFRFAKSADDTIALDGRWDYDGDEAPLGHDDWDLTLSTEDVPPELIAAFEDSDSFEEP